MKKKLISWEEEFGEKFNPNSKINKEIKEFIKNYRNNRKTIFDYIITEYENK